MNTPLILQTAPLGLHWPTLDPFLFCAHHNDAYPKGTESFGPDPALLAGRNIGSDFEVKDGFRMYHGEVVPGFPQHPHRGFETVTLVREGLIDHADSLGAKARFGQGDVQWITAGKGIVHSEMMPLLHREQANPIELFQIWLNLHSSDKMSDPQFTMSWADQIPRVIKHDGGKSEAVVIAGDLFESKPPAPPPRSWASRPEADVAIVALKLEPGAKLTLPPAQPGTIRTLYFFLGDEVTVGDTEVFVHQAMVMEGDREVPLLASGKQAIELLLLQGRPIGEPVAQHGPFVMNTRAELQRAFTDYQATRFGGWPHDSDGPVHGSAIERFADRGDGRRETPSSVG